MLKTYTVTVTVQYPAWDERDGIRFHDIMASNKAEAIKKARRHSNHYGIIHSQQGRATWKATEQND